MDDAEETIRILLRASEAKIKRINELEKELDNYKNREKSKTDPVIKEDMFLLFSTEFDEDSIDIIGKYQREFGASIYEQGYQLVARQESNLEFSIYLSTFEEKTSLESTIAVIEKMIKQKTKEEEEKGETKINELHQIINKMSLCQEMVNEREKTAKLREQVGRLTEMNENLRKQITGKDRMEPLESHPNGDITEANEMNSKDLVKMCKTETSMQYVEPSPHTSNLVDHPSETAQKNRRSNLVVELPEEEKDSQHEEKLLRRHTSGHTYSPLGRRSNMGQTKPRPVSMLESEGREDEWNVTPSELIPAPFRRSSARNTFRKSEIDKFFTQKNFQLIQNSPKIMEKICNQLSSNIENTTNDLAPPFKDIESMDFQKLQLNDYLNHLQADPSRTPRRMNPHQKNIKEWFVQHGDQYFHKLSQQEKQEIKMTFAQKYNIDAIGTIHFMTFHNEGIEYFMAMAITNCKIICWYHGFTQVSALLNLNKKLIEDCQWTSEYRFVTEIDVPGSCSLFSNCTDKDVYTENAKAVKFIENNFGFMEFDMLGEELLFSVCPIYNLSVKYFEESS